MLTKVKNLTLFIIIGAALLYTLVEVLPKVNTLTKPGGHELVINFTAIGHPIQSTPIHVEVKTKRTVRKWDQQVSEKGTYTFEFTDPNYDGYDVWVLGKEKYYMYPHRLMQCHIYIDGKPVRIDPEPNPLQVAEVYCEWSNGLPGD